MLNRLWLKYVCLVPTGLVCALAVWATYHYLTARTALDLTRLASYTVEELIDGLQDEALEGLGTHSTVLADGFLAINEAPEFRSGMLGSEKLAVSPVMRELVRRGVVALPALLDHLEDRRTTRLVIKLPFGEFFGGMWHSDEYEYRFSDEENQPSGVNSGDGEERRTVDGDYRVRVGDLCFVIIGQIVNRRLHVVRYQPSACIVINSPVETPSLAAAVRADWHELNVEQHEKSLVEDLKDASESAQAAALVRLRFYYPEAAVRIAERALPRRIPAP